MRAIVHKETIGGDPSQHQALRPPNLPLLTDSQHIKAKQQQPHKPSLRHRAATYLLFALFKVSKMNMRGADKLILDLQCFFFLPQTYFYMIGLQS